MVRYSRWLGQILGISWKDKVTNVKVRELTGMPMHIIREWRLRWAGHVWRMPNDSLARSALNWTLAGCKRKPGRPRMDWIQTVKEDIARAVAKWDDVPQLVIDRKFGDCWPPDASMVLEDLRSKDSPMLSAPWHQSMSTYSEPSFPVPPGRQVGYGCVN